MPDTYDERSDADDDDEQSDGEEAEVEEGPAAVRRRLSEQSRAAANEVARRARRAPVVLELVFQGAQFLVEEAVRRPVRAHVRQAQVEEERLPPRAPEPLVRDVQRPAQHRDDAVGHEDAPQAPLSTITGSSRVDARRGAGFSRKQGAQVPREGNLRHSSTMLQAVDDVASMELQTCHAFPNSAKIDSILVYRNNATDCRQ